VAAPMRSRHTEAVPVREGRTSGLLSRDHQPSSNPRPAGGAPAPALPSAGSSTVMSRASRAGAGSSPLLYCRNNHLAVFFVRAAELQLCGP
jgi:hypothetical protein